MTVVQNTLPKTKKKSAGFTLLELLVVLGILGLLAALALPRVTQFFGDAKRDTAVVQIKALKSALEFYRLDMGDLPTTELGLNALITEPANALGWRGPYLTETEGLTDPWGRPYLYKAPGDHGDYDLYSLGSDGAEGGEGEAEDVTSW